MLRFILVLGAALASAQPVQYGPFLDKPVISTYTVAKLPTGFRGMLAGVSDGANATDCSTGGGSTYVLCYHNGTDWAAVSAAGGSGDVLGGSNLTTAGRPVVVQSAGTVTETASLSVGQGGTGLTSGTSGGVLYFDSSSTIASSDALTLYGLLVGGGAGNAPYASSSITTDASGRLGVGKSPSANIDSAGVIWVNPSTGHAGVHFRISDSFKGFVGYNGSTEMVNIGRDGDLANGINIDANNRVGIGTADLDGTPAVGQATVKGTTTDGSTNAVVLRNSSESNILSIDTLARMSWTSGVTYSNLGTPSDGTIVYCSDCKPVNPCSGSGTGAIAQRINGAWNCSSASWLEAGATGALTIDRDSWPHTIDIDTDVMCTKTGACAPTGAFDLSGSSKTSPFRIGSADPETCDASVREFFYNTSANALKVCNATNTWTAVGGGGATAPTGYVWGFTGQWPLIYNSYSNLSLTANTVYCFKMPVLASGTIGKLRTWIRTGFGAGIGVAAGIYDSSGNLLKQDNEVAPNGQPHDFTLSGGQAVTAGTMYYACIAAEDNSGNFLSMFSSTNDATFYNSGSALAVVTAQNSASGTGAGFALPNTLGTLTARNDHIPFLVGVQ